MPPLEQRTLVKVHMARDTDSASICEDNIPNDESHLAVELYTVPTIAKQASTL